MKKSELIQALALYPEEAEIVLWNWDGHKSSYEFLNSTCTSYPDPETGKLRHPDHFDLSHSYCPFTPAEEVKEKGPVEDDRQLGDLKPKRIGKRCTYCGDTGHSARTCPLRKAERKAAGLLK